MRLMVFHCFHVNDADHAFLEVGRGQHRFALVFPGNARAQMRQAGQFDVGDLAPDEQVHHLAVLALACRADEVLIRRVEEEIVEVVIEPDAPHRKQAPFRRAPRPCGSRAPTPDTPVRRSGRR